MRSRGFDKKYPNHYDFKTKGLYIYLLLDGQKAKARQVLKEMFKGSFTGKLAFFLLSYLPASVINKLLKLYRKKTSQVEA
jgi:hypothetical protein